ncbi:MAG: hypothetical protein IBX70_10940 [Clostridia bacterium]|nr:hypothetical protein [Clostridia bacterium]
MGKSPFDRIEYPKLKFVKAEATDTRLMGVVGVIAHWLDPAGREVVQIYHLDFESYGIDGFYHLIEPNMKELENLILGITGGLGGSFIQIGLEEFIFLIKSSYIVDEGCLDALVDFEMFEEQFDSLYVDLSLEDEIRLYEKLSPEIILNEQAVHYFVMRYIGCDYPSAMMLWKDGKIDPDFELLDMPHTLIKNNCVHVGQESRIDQYTVEALVDYETRYKLMIIHVDVEADTHKIVRANCAEEMVISSIEAAFNLSKPEYMMVMHVQDSFFERRFAKTNPEMMKQSYPQGQLYIEFNPDNDHVKENPYFLNGDIYALYFFGYDGQLIVCTMRKENLEEIDKMLKENHAYDESLGFICELKTDEPVLFTYVNSSYDNIFDYLATT